MNKNHNEIPFIVIDMNNNPNDPWNLFCGYDPEHHRITFFRDLNMFGLPQLQEANKPIWITVERSGTIIESGSPHIIGGHGDQYQLSGFDGVRKEITDKTKLPAYLFQPNDYVFIRGALWGKLNPINALATRRKRGVLAKEVFDKYLDDRNKIRDFFSEQPSCSRITLNFQMAQVVFENYPGKRYAEFF